MLRADKTFLSSVREDSACFQMTLNLFSIWKSQLLKYPGHGLVCRSEMEGGDGQDRSERSGEIPDSISVSRALCLRLGVLLCHLNTLPPPLCLLYIHALDSVGKSRPFAEQVDSAHLVESHRASGRVCVCSWLKATFMTSKIPEIVTSSQSGSWEPV